MRLWFIRPKVKTLGTYLSQVLMVPYERSAAFFRDAIKLPVSAGSLCNFNASAADNLTGFMESAKEVLQQAQVLHVDETGINIDGKKEWCHCASSEDATILQPHDCRNEETVLSLGIIHKFKGVLVHDFWAVYFAFTNCLHAVCNAHILRELLKASENFKQKWASFMLDFLLDFNLWVKACGGKLSDELQELVRMDYQRLIKQGEVECPETPKPPGKRSRAKQSVPRNLLVRLKEHEDEVLRFITEEIIPFTNNDAERQLRILKVQQKISGAFRSFDGAVIHTKIRSYLLTCAKNGVDAYEALEILFNKQYPSFVDEWSNTNETMAVNF